MTTFKNRTPGRCIYCGAGGQLGREHIVPESLGGRDILPGASCRACEKVTSDIERVIAREMYGQFRIRQKIAGKKKRRPPTPDVLLRSGEEGSQIELRVAEPGAISMFPIVAPPPLGIFSDPPVRNGHWVGAAISHKTQQPTQPELWRALPRGPLSFQGPSLHMPTLGRFIAKVAHAYASAVFGLDRFDPWLVPIILGADLDFAFLVGASPAEPVSLNVVSILNWTAFQHDDKYMLAVDVGLFPSLGQPWLRAVAGLTTPAHATQVLAEETR